MLEMSWVSWEESLRSTEEALERCHESYAELFKITQAILDLKDNPVTRSSMKQYQKEYKKAVEGYHKAICFIKERCST
jgi:hypothetical protein